MFLLLFSKQDETHMIGQFTESRYLGNTIIDLTN